MWKWPRRRESHTEGMPTLTLETAGLAIELMAQLEDFRTTVHNQSERHESQVRRLENKLWEIEKRLDNMQGIR